VKLIVGGRRYSHFLDAKVDVQIDALARAFEFRAATRGVDDIPFRCGQSVAIEVDGDRVLTGWIEQITIEATTDGVVYRISGRDKMADVIDSNLDGMSALGTTLAHVCSATLRYLGVDAKVVDRSGTNGRTFDGAAELAAPEAGETAFEFLRSVAARRQALLRSDGDGNLVVVRGEAEPVDAKLVNRVDGQGNNLLRMRWSTDHSQRFHLYSVRAQANVASLGFFDIDTPAEDIAAGGAEYRDRSIRASRRRSIASESSYAPGDAASRARWESSLARARAVTYEVEVEGWRTSAGALWEVNTAPFVEDGYAGVRRRMLISGLSFTASESGPRTTITLTRLDAYRAEAAIEDIEARAADIDALGDVEGEDDWLGGVPLELE
jgi:prophage tail gpP-like protein